MENKEKKSAHRVWREIDQFFYDFGDCSVYDEPDKAFVYGTILSPYCLALEDWEKWKHEHYIGDTGYDHETGKIVNEKQRAIFERLHPNFEEEQLRKKEKNFEETDEEL